MVVTLSGIVIFVRLVQLMKAKSPMVVTLSGIVMLVRLVQPSKAEPSMLVRPSGIVMLFRLVQLAKAAPPMVLMLLGIVMLVRLEREPKALVSILVTGFPSMFAGIISSPDAILSQRVIVTISPLISYFKTEGRSEGRWLHPERTKASDIAKRGTDLTMGTMPAA